MKTKTAIIIALIIIALSLFFVLLYKKDRETQRFVNVRYVNENLNEIVNRESSNETIELFLEE